jgi:hypothetical protein
MFGVGSVFYKDCIKCNSTLPSKKFDLRTDTKRLRPDCNPCRKLDMRRNYAEHKQERIKKTTEYARNNYHQKILSGARKTAKTKNLEFNLTLDDIIIPEYCPYLGTEITQILGSGVVWTNASIDRIDSSKGYIKGNVEIISRKANSMKNMATKEEMVVFAKNVLKLLGE